MLAKVRQFNIEAEKIMKEGTNLRLAKLKCDAMGESCETVLSNCDNCTNCTNSSNEAENISPEETLLHKAESASGCLSCGPKLEEKMSTPCVNCGDEWVREDWEMCLVGNDVVALFPSIQSTSTGRIVRKEVEESPMQIEGFDHRLGAQHIAMNKKYTGDLAPIANILPWRSKAPGCAPGMKSKWVNCKENKEDVKWNFPKAKPYS